MIGPVIFPRNRLVSPRPRWILVLIRFLRGHVRPLDRRCRHSSHEQERSIEFYTKVFDLEEIDRGGDDEGKYVLLRDRRSGQRVELNWYAERSPFWAPYFPGEALDHFEVRVKDVPETLQRLKKLGVLPATRKLWVNRKTVAKLKDDPKFAKLMQEDMWTSRNGHRIAYIRDPDGIFFCLYDHPEEPWEGPIPDHY